MADIDDSYNVLPARGGYVTTTSGYTLDHRIDVPPAGPLDLRKLRVDVEMPEGYQMLRDVVIIHDPRHQTFWWTPLAAGPQPRRTDELNGYPGPSAALHAGSDGIAAARMADSSLLLRTSVGHASTMDDAQRAVIDAISRDPELVRKPDEAFHRIDLGSRLEASFFEAGRPAVVRNLARENGRWLVVIEGVQGALADIEIAGDLTLVDVRRHR
jgi:hypothetical protein